MGHDEPASTLGTCPLCEQPIDAESLLAQYTPTDESAKTLAECSACREIVQPI